MHIKNTISCWEMMKEVEMAIGLMMFDTLACSFKRKVYCWLREAAQRVKSSKCSSRSSRSVSDNESMNSKKSKDSHESRSSRESRETRSSKSSRHREIEEKMKVAELIAEAELFRTRQRS